jgi:hypothetical protein
MILLALQQGTRSRKLFLAGLLAGSALLVKIDGFAIPLTLLVTMLVECASRRMRRTSS